VDQTDIEKLRVTIADKYSFDLKGINDDTAAIEEIIAHPSPADSLALYLKGLSGEIIRP
jgi:hypothetical protein